VGRANFPTTATLPAAGHSFLSVEGPALLSAFYSDGEDVLVRLYENTGQAARRR